MASACISKTIPIQCKVKYDIWGDDMIFDELPISFLEMVKLFSKLFFPNNFSVNYIDSNYSLQPIDAQSYKELISVINKSDLKEIRLLVNLFEGEAKGGLQRRLSQNLSRIEIPKDTRVDSLTRSDIVKGTNKVCLERFGKTGKREKITHNDPLGDVYIF
jgi:hypothetical protein